MEDEGGIIQRFILANTHRVYTTDNAGSCKSAFQNKDSIAWFGCLAHILHLMIKKGLTVHEVTALLNKLHAISAFFHKSPKSNILLKENAEWLGFPQLSVLSEVPTRWNSFLISGRRFL